MVRMLLAAAESLADIFDRSRLGIAIAAMIRMLATTISSSINEKPFCLRIFNLSPLEAFGFRPLLIGSADSEICLDDCSSAAISTGKDRTCPYITDRYETSAAKVRNSKVVVS